ncbi:hypothetical protein AAC387_Pa01g1469 [Persea americana]
MAESEHPRLLLPSFISPNLCKELEFIHKSCSSIGYRPRVFSTTLSHLIATNCPHLILPFIPIRERLKEKVEEFFGCEYELFIEFTGLISWCKGANIGWHSDDNRPYLKQRNFAAVCYLNSHGLEFEGGMFHFQDGDPATIVPMAGDVVIYTADSRNVHSVDEIINGERLTLTLWFTLDHSHDEDAKLISLLSQNLMGREKPDSYLPLPASNNMYWFSADSASPHESGFDIRWARVHTLGYSFYASDDMPHTSDSSSDPLELLMGPLQLARDGEIFEKEFADSLHALQVVQFYHWKTSELQGTEWSRVISKKNMRLSHPLPDNKNALVFSGDHHLVDEVLVHVVSSCNQIRPPFKWNDFAAAMPMWEDYILGLQRELMTSMPYWTTHQALYTVTFIDA